MVYAKKIVGDVKLTTYGRVLYTNLLASVPCGIMCKSFENPVIIMHALALPRLMRRASQRVVADCMFARLHY